MARPYTHDGITPEMEQALAAYVAATIPLIVEETPTANQVLLSRNRLAQLTGTMKRRSQRRGKRNDKRRRRVLRLL